MGSGVDDGSMVLEGRMEYESRVDEVTIEVGSRVL